MIKAKLNREYAARHLFVCVLMFALSVWFAWDGLAAYPSLAPAELYEKIEKAPPPEGMTTESLAGFKRQKIQAQCGLSVLSFLAFLIVGTRLAASARFRLEYGEDCFVYAGLKFPYSAITKVDDSLWKKKGISTVCAAHSGRMFRIRLDAWHHTGVREFRDKALAAAGMEA